MDVVLFGLYLALLAVGVGVGRDLGRTVVAVVLGLTGAGVLINLALDLGLRMDRMRLQIVLAVTLALVVASLLWRRPSLDGQGRRAFLGIGLPVLLGFLAIAVITVRWTTPDPGFLHPVSFLIGHGTAEDNAKWLDFTAQFATGRDIVQGVPMGGPLQLIMTFWATGMAAVSEIKLGGYNEVAVAANAVVYVQLGFAALAPVALSPLVRLRRRNGSALARRQIPVPGLWAGGLAIAAAVLVVTGYGHLTFQYSMIVAALWSSVFLASNGPRRRILASLAVAGAMTVWLPLNALALGILVVVAIVLVRRSVRHGLRSLDLIAVAAWAVVVVGTWEPIRSSMSFVLNSGGPSALGYASGAGRLAASVQIPALSLPHLALNEVGLFSSPGGTEPIGPVLALLTAAAALTTGMLVLRRPRGRALRMLPIAVLATYAVAIYALDAWVTGSAPHYGSLKFGFLAVIVTLATTSPLVLLAVDRASVGMTPLRWTIVGALVLLLMVDTLLPRSIAAARPQQWSPALPYSNTKSWWWPADVNGTADQSVTANPIGCVYLPNGASAPSAILASQLSGGDRVYACTRILAGLGGVDSTAQPLVDWLRREWLTNTPAWNDVHGYLEDMPAEVRARPIILLDDMSNVVGLESLDSLLTRFPAR